VNFLFLVVQKLKALHYWALLRKCQGISVNQTDASEITEKSCTMTMQQLQKESKIKTALEDQIRTKPRKLGWLGLDSLAKVLGRAADIPVAMLWCSPFNVDLPDQGT
jgi:hypothetical protein